MNTKIKGMVLYTCFFVAATGHKSVSFTGLENFQTDSWSWLQGFRMTGWDTVGNCE